MEGAHRTVVASVHCLQQIESLRSAYFADDDSFWAHTQAVADEVAHGDLALAFEIGRPRFKAHDVRLLQLQFRSVFAGNDTFVMVDKLGEAVKKRGFS